MVKTTADGKSLMQEAEIDMLSEEEAKQEIRPALRRMKPFYGLPADGRWNSLINM